METNKHFILTDEFKINEKGIKLFRIKCIKKFNNVNVGDLGGFIERYENLSENAWVGDSAKVFGDSYVRGTARVYGNARVCGAAEVFGGAEVFDDAYVRGDARVFGYAQIFGDAYINDSAWVGDSAKVFGDSYVRGTARVYGNAEVYGNVQVDGNAEISGNAEVRSHLDYSCFQSFGVAGRTTTVFREKENKIKINCGCFSGSIEKFEKRVEETRGNSKFGREYKAIINVIKVKFDLI